ncbi:lipopolysaccharide export system protein LptA [Devosia enhydra]|uniref:Lipopolysaccharide export system protein LptA n=1 Tax=Devosia enhydra TaxID=665118 RepID=A0A1K2I2H6_9HYPH|nr:LptA/OstA family protein [Devosia enhydra]SFZ86536.1 lipopolysaccharide export system protein LptA [Devosia enhydra]
MTPIRALILVSITIGLFSLPTSLTPVLAQATAAAGAAQSSVKITADRFVIDEKASTAQFSGNVVVLRQAMTVWADQVVVNLGDGGAEDIRDFVATGNVRIKTDTQEATGRRAVFDPKTQLLRLTENVRVTNASGTVNAPELVVNLETNQTVFSGSSGNRVTGVFTPQ